MYFTSIEPSCSTFEKMTDLQIENIYKLISDLKDFENSVVNQTEFSNNPNLGIQFLEDGLVILNTGVKQIHVTKENVHGLIFELKQQEKKSIESSKKFNPRSELKELGNGQYEMSDEYLTDLFYARQVSSGYGVYKRKLIEISKVFRSGNSLKYMEKDFLSIDEFSNDLLSNLNDFKSIEDELQK